MMTLVVNGKSVNGSSTHCFQGDACTRVSNAFRGSASLRTHVMAAFVPQRKHGTYVKLQPMSTEQGVCYIGLREELLQHHHGSTRTPRGMLLCCSIRPAGCCVAGSPYNGIVVREIPFFLKLSCRHLVCISTLAGLFASDDLFRAIVRHHHV